MGYNLVWFCEKHDKWAYSMRGEEGYDFQWIARNHRHCWENNHIKVFMDCDTDLPSDESRSMWEHEERPKILKQNQALDGN